MREYPSIPSSLGQSFREFDAHVFDKIDGSNLRFGWSKKRGWHKQGTRTRLFDETDLEFGKAISIFKELLADNIEKVARDQRWEDLTVFTEFYGSNSFAGVHDPTDAHTLALIDVATFTGLLSPTDFIKRFNGLPMPAYLGRVKWTRGYVEEVRQGNVVGITREGVVGKVWEGSKRIMAKAKTQAWVDAVKIKYGKDADKLL